MSRPLNKNGASKRKIISKKVEEQPEQIHQIAQPSSPPTPQEPVPAPVPVINVEKAQEIQKQDVEETMTVYESVQALLPTIGAGLILLLMILSLLGHYYSTIFG